MNKLKKLSALLICAVLILAVVPAMTVSAAEIVDSGVCGGEAPPWDNLTWTLDSEGTLVISGKGYMGNYTYSESPFINKPIKKVIINEGAVNISTGAFTGCELTTISIPSSVTSIDAGAFYRCAHLRSIYLPNVESIGVNAFYGCGSLERATMGEGLLTVGESAFDGCTSLEEITLPYTVKYIGDDAFYGTAYCYKNDNWETTENGSALYIGHHLIEARIDGEYEINAATRTIAAGAFDNIYTLTGVTIPASVVSICDGAFAGCTALENIHIPSSVTLIGERAFAGCTALTSVKLPDGLTSLSPSLFWGCTSLRRIELPENLTSIGEDVLFNTEIYNKDGNWDENGLLYIDNYLFNARKSATGDIAIRPGTKTIASWAFNSCDGLTGITVPEGITTIDDYTFNNCTALKSISLPLSIKSISFNAFSSSFGNISDVYYAGGPEDWAKIEQNPLGGFNVHFAAPELSAPEVSANGNKIKVVVKAKNLPSSAVLIAVGYGDDGGFEAVAPVIGDEADIDGERVKSVKVFAWESLESMRPLCSAKGADVQ